MIAVPAASEWGTDELLAMPAFERLIRFGAGRTGEPASRPSNLP